MNAILDGRSIETRAQLHDALQAQLGLPDYYGRNLDALFDCLTEPDADHTIVLRSWEEMKASLGFYASSLQIVLRRAMEENPRLHVLFED